MWMRTVVKVLGCEDLYWFFAIHLYDKCKQEYKKNAL